MTLREPRGNESDEEELERLGLEGEIMGDKETKRIIRFRPPPFLLVDEIHKGRTNYFLVESWKSISVDNCDNGSFMQTLQLKAHQATEEEIKHFLRDEDE